VLQSTRDVHGAPATLAAAASNDRPVTRGVRVALGTVHVVWGSTCLAIEYAVGGLPPFLAMGFRFLLVGGNGLVAVAGQDVGSGLAALLIAGTLLWVVLLRAILRDRPSAATVAGPCWA
jgi:hypothetical protein